MDEGEEFARPQPSDIGRRALILSGVVCRASLEGYTDESYVRDTAGSIIDWFDDLDLWPYVEPDEERILRSQFGQLPKPLQVCGTWFIEGLALLAWAMRRGDLPSHDQQVDPIGVTNSLDFLEPSAAELIIAPRLRDHAELNAAREWYYDVHCTLRGFLHHGGDGQLAKWIVDCLAILELSPETVMHHGSLALKGVPIGEVEREGLETWEWVIRERHRAAIWLEGEYPRYTELPVDT
jgi:hypothetical protein